MAQEIQGEKVTITREGRMTLMVNLLFNSRREALANYPRLFEGLAFDGANGEPRAQKNGKWILSARYSGVIDEPTEKDDTFQIIGEEREVPIENFPDRALLEEDYGAYEYEGGLLFPYRLPVSNELGSPLTLNSYQKNSNKDINPLYNTKSYPVEYQVAVWRMVRRRVPAIVAGWQGTVLSKLPAGFAGMGARTPAKWYVRPLKVNKRGNAVDVEVQFKEISDLISVEAINSALAKLRKGRGNPGTPITS